MLGGYVQINFEDGDVSAFEGRFGQTALKDRFRLRRARINLTGDFAEQFDFKVEGDFENSDGINSNRTAFSGTDIFVNWHQFAEANIKAGQWKAPFGLEQLTPDPTLIIIERSLPTGAITPERQIGVQLWGKPFANIWPAHWGDHTGAADRCSALGKTLREHLACWEGFPDILRWHIQWERTQYHR